MTMQICFFLNSTPTSEIYTLSLHDALPIFLLVLILLCVTIFVILVVWFLLPRVARLMIHTDRKSGSAGMPRPSSYAVFCLKKKKRRADFPSRRFAPAGRTAFFNRDVSRQTQ